MAIPDFQSIMLPLLELASDGKEHSIRDAVEALARRFDLTAEERRQMLPSGAQATFDNRVHWSRSYLKQAGLLGNPKRGVFCISPAGRKVLSENPKRIDLKYLERFPAFQEFRARKGPGNEQPAALDSGVEVTPREQIEIASQRIRLQLAGELLTTVLSMAPGRFERLVVELMVAMGYGGSLRDAGRAIGGTGDEGIDGVINEDRLGLDVIYLQAKRWTGPVGRPEIQKFAGALQGQRARKGVFITTSTFSGGAREFAERIESKIVLIDGQQLAQLMIDFNLGVAPEASYEIKRIDSDYFTDE